MRFVKEFLLCLRWRPAQAIEAAYWRITRRRVRARNCLRRDVGEAPYAYDLWLSTVEGPAAQQYAAQLKEAGGQKISVIMTDCTVANPTAIDRSLLSLKQQSYANWELLLPVEAREPFADSRIRPISSTTETSPFTQAVLQASGTYIFRLRAGNRLPALALQILAAAARGSPSSLIIYGDQDQMDETGTRGKPWLKPKWNSEMFLSQDYLSDACLIESQHARSALAADPSAPEVSPYSLLLAATATQDDAILHVPHIVCHVDAASDRNSDGNPVDTVMKALHKQGATATNGPFGTVRVRWPLPTPLPHVSIVIPTRDKLNLLRPCVSSLLKKTGYPSFDLIIVDNQSALQETKDYLCDIADIENVSVLDYDKPYNYAAINNFAVEHASGGIICLLNNDTEVINGAWLEELVRYATRPEIGAAGAMLLYDDNSIQHAGVVIGMGQAAGHAHRSLACSEAGYFCRAHVPHFVSAVTAACLLVERYKFDAVGGLDEAGFSIAFNDVDFCLKLEQAGWRNVYVPQAQLYHYESRSRGSDLAPANIERYRRELELLQDRWGTKTYVDPLHHPFLDRSFETYTIDLGN